MMEENPSTNRDTTQSLAHTQVVDNYYLKPIYFNGFEFNGFETNFELSNFEMPSCKV